MAPPDEAEVGGNSRNLSYTGPLLLDQWIARTDMVGSEEVGIEESLIMKK